MPRSRSSPSRARPTSNVRPVDLDGSNDRWAPIERPGLWRGTVAPLMLIIICPTAVNLFALTMIDPELDGSVAALIQRLTSPGGAAALVREAFPAPTPRAVAFLAGLLLLQILLLVVVPGQRFHGPRAPSGHVPQYTDNGFACFFITLATLAI